MGIFSLSIKLQLLLQLNFHVLLLLVHHHYHVNLLAESSSCNSSSYGVVSQSCANLGSNISYPFTSCAFSNPSFLLSNCSSQQAYWDAFTYTIPANEASIIGPPAVVGISSANSFTYINLTWDSDLISQPHTSRNACSPPVPLHNLSRTIPSFIDLTNFANSTFSFSSNNVYLLFNCTTRKYSGSSSVFSSQSYEYTQASPLCSSYRWQCTLMEEYGQCFQLHLEILKMQQLSLQNAMRDLGCSHFQFFVTKTGADDDYDTITEWSKGILQLQWTDTDCQNCLDNGGESCRLDNTNHTLEQCYCSDGTVSGPRNHCSDAAGNKGISQSNVQVLVIVGLCLTVGTLLVLAFYCGRRNRRRRSIQKLTKFPKQSAWPRRQESSGSNDSLNDLDLNGLSERPMEYSYTSIASATSSFSCIVGKGGFGKVFKGVLDDHPGAAQGIAVKVLEATSKHSRKQFLNEVAIIGRIHHVNVVRLLGFCVQQDEHEMLVYEYVENGSLDGWLFGCSTKRRGAAGDQAVQLPEKELEWGQRYGIALGVAKGLSYLHEECRHRIVHCDIKPQNILLDACMCPKIADFGLARLMSRDESRMVTLAKGTPGYMAPEFWVGGNIHLSTKADVYSFGMVLLELVSGRRNFALGCRRFPTLAFEAAMRGDLKSIFDVRLQAVMPTAALTEEQRFLMWQQVRTAVFVALWCIQEHPESRPCMSEVVQYLEGIAAVSEQPPWPAIAATSASPPPAPRLRVSTPPAISPTSPQSAWAADSKSRPVQASKNKPSSFTLTALCTYKLVSQLYRT